MNMGIFSKLFGPKNPDPRSQQEIDEQIVIIDSITRGDSWIPTQKHLDYNLLSILYNM